MPKRRIRPLVLDHGPYHRLEVVKGLEPGTAIRFGGENGSQKLVFSWLSPRAGEEPAIREPDTFLSTHGFSNGRPIIEIRRPNGAVETVEAFSYAFAEGEKKGQPICCRTVCRKRDASETTAENRADAPY